MRDGCESQLGMVLKNKHIAIDLFPTFKKEKMEISFKFLIFSTKTD